jgi:hypothetical protein
VAQRVGTTEQFAEKAEQARLQDELKLLSADFIVLLFDADRQECLSCD